MSAIQPTIIAYTSEDDRLSSVRREGEALARTEGASLILYDIDAANPLEGSPLPNEWSADGEAERIPDRLAPADLERAGRHAIADQVQGARQRGVDAWGWLPADPGGDALRDYVEQVGARVVLLPPELESPDLLDRLMGRTAQDAAKHAPAGVDVRVVGDEGGDDRGSPSRAAGTAAREPGAP